MFIQTAIFLILLYVVIKTASYGGWCFKKGEYKGAISVFILSCITVFCGVILLK